MAFNFSDALKQRENEYRLRGTQMPQQEVSGIAEGYSDSASQRLSRQNALKLQKEKIDEQKRQFDASQVAARDVRKKKEHASKGETVGSVIGGIVGGVASFYTGGALAPLGAAIGGAIGKNCIIISACTSKDSYGVEIAREFRDKYMSEYHLGGYLSLIHI